MKKAIFYSICLLFLLYCISTLSHSATPSYKLSHSFPSDYQPYIDELQKKHPSWSFKALYTNLDWNYVIQNETVFGKNLVPKSYSDNWKNTTPGQYNVEVDAGWVDSSRAAVEYCMDPRNFLNEVRVFQFEELSHNPQTHFQNAVEKILYGTEFYERKVEYKNASGTIIYTDKTYADLIFHAGITSTVSPYHLASRIKQEVGPFLSHSSISGTVPGFEGYYNFYNIGATSSAEPMGAIKNGLQYAKDGKGASASTKDKYLIPWNTKERSITGGGIFIGSSYIALGQNTIYLQKFHVVDASQGSLFWHQYMTNVLAPYSEGKLTYQGYAKSNLLDLPLSFVVPIYNNMPALPTETPHIGKQDFVSDNTSMYANVTTSLNVRSGPGTSYEVLTSLPAKEVVTRIAKGTQVGERWDRVKLSNGMIGYVFQSYLEPAPTIQIEHLQLSIERTSLIKQESLPLRVTIQPFEASHLPVFFQSSDVSVAIVNADGTVYAVGPGSTTITVSNKAGTVTDNITISVWSPVTRIELPTSSLLLETGTSYPLTPIIYPEDASNKHLLYTSSTPSIASISSNGVVTAGQPGSTTITIASEDGYAKVELPVQIIEPWNPDEITFHPPLVVSGNSIKGLSDVDTRVQTVRQSITTSYTLEFYHATGKRLQDTDSLGTHSTMCIYDENQKLRYKYYFVLYGDVNGDGKINSTDLLVLQRHILEIEPLKETYLMSGNINKNGKNPSSLDSLLIQRHILGLSMISQS